MLKATEEDGADRRSLEKASYSPEGLQGTICAGLPAHSGTGS